MRNLYFAVGDNKSGADIQKAGINVITMPSLFYLFDKEPEKITSGTNVFISRLNKYAQIEGITENGLFKIGGILYNESELTPANIYTLKKEVKNKIKGLPIDNVILLMGANALNEADKYTNFGAVRAFRSAFNGLVGKTYFVHCRAGFEALTAMIEAHGGKAVKNSLDSLQTNSLFSCHELTAENMPNIRTYFNLNGHFIQPDKVIKANERLSECAAEIYEQLQQHNRLLLKANTGLGKTYATLRGIVPRWLSEPNTTGKRRAVFVVPYTQILEQLYYSEIYCNGNHSDPFLRGLLRVNGMSFKSFPVYGKNFSRQKLETADPDIILVTYDSLQKVSQYINKDTLLVLDEIHAPIDEYSFKNKKSYPVSFNTLLQAQNCIAISATPNAILQKMGFYALQVNAKRTIELNVTRNDYSGSIVEAITSNILQYTGGGRIVVRLSSREKTQKIIENLLVAGYDQNQIEALNSGVKETSKSYHSIARRSIIPENVKILFTTPLLDSGVNIKNSDIDRVIIADTNVNKITPTSFLQFAARFRDMEAVNVHLFKLKEKSAKEGNLNIVNEYNRLLKDVEEKVNIVNIDQIHCPNDVRQQHITKINILNDFSTYILLTKKGYQVNNLAVLFDVYRHDNQNRSINQFYTEIKRAENVNIVGTVNNDCQNEITAPEAKQEKKNKYTQLIEFLYNEGKEVFILGVYMHTPDDKLKRLIEDYLGYKPNFINDYEPKIKEMLSSKEIVNYSKWIIYLFRKGFSHVFIVEFLRHIDGSQAAFNLFNDGISILFGLYHPETLERRQKKDFEKIVKVREHIYSSFKGKELNCREWKNILNDVYKKYNIKKADSKRTDLINILFDIREKTRTRTKTIQGIKKLENFVQCYCKKAGIHIPIVCIDTYSISEFDYEFEMSFAEKYFNGLAESKSDRVNDCNIRPTFNYKPQARQLSLTDSEYKIRAEILDYEGAYLLYQDDLTA